MKYLVSQATAFVCIALAFSSAVSAAELPSPITDDMFKTPDMAEVKLGQLLFWDPILSGNKNISCGTCHHPKFGTADGVSLSLGEGAHGLGPERHSTSENTPEELIPRNAPALFNLGAAEFKILFHDGRVAVDDSQPSGFQTPMKEEMMSGANSLLAAQAMFPVLSADEMAGHYSENDVAKAVRQGRTTGAGGAWDILATRVRTIPEYATAFSTVYPDISAGREINFTDIANAVAAFIAFEWRSDTSPFDAVLRGELELSEQASAGADLFYGSAGCSACHTGPFLTDNDFHAMAEPQFGPGKAAKFENHSRDTGRMAITGKAEDAFCFRTPSLRNVALTGPYGHAGSFRDLNAYIAYHSDPETGLKAYDRNQPILPVLESKPIWAVMDDTNEWGTIYQALERTPVSLATPEIDQIVAFLHSLTDPAARGRLGIPDAVPSGLPIDR